MEKNNEGTMGQGRRDVQEYREDGNELIGIRNDRPKGKGKGFYFGIDSRDKEKGLA